jgi:two-component system LytT family response regulator
MDTKPIRVLIADNDVLARLKIREMLENDSDIQIVAESGIGADAVEEIRKHHPDLLFLDVLIPSMEGLNVLQALEEEELPAVILVTPFDPYGLKTLALHGLDYICKPLEYDRFENTMELVKSRIRQKKNGELTYGIRNLLQEMRSRIRYLDRLVVKNGDRVAFIKTETIDWIEADGDYVKLHVGNQTHLLRESIRNLAYQLNPEKFLRIRRSIIVNVDRITELQT